MIDCMHDGNDASCPTCGTFLINAHKLVESDSPSDEESTTMDDSNAPFPAVGGPSGTPPGAGARPTHGSGSIVEENAVLLEENRKLTRSLLELQVETERLKQQQNLLSGLGRRRDSLSGLSSTSQPLGSMGQNSPAPSYRSTGGGTYTSGIVADVVREIRDICRVREDATFERLRNAQENHMWSINDTLQRLAKDVDAMAKSVGAARHDLEKLTGRVLQLESIVLPQATVCLAGAAAAAHQHTAMSLFGGNVQQALLLQQLQQQQQQQHQHQQQQHSPQQQQQQQQQQYHSYATNERTAQQQQQQASPCDTKPATVLRLNYGRIGHTEDLFSPDAVGVAELGNGAGPAPGGPTSNTAPTNSSSGAPSHEASTRVLLLEKGEVELRRDLQDAIAAKNEQSQKIAYLQKVVIALQKKVDLQATTTTTTAAADTGNSVTGGNNGIGVIGPVTDL
uniref:Uncharacterized protein n=1 Tax=Anopheles dirus TaxID=7168 RepID=A0A182N0R7_9DIPT